ncbi:precorrin-2 dehydrogenase/sirohydrochlorin ferrochelatase family protein [Natronobiforma cellulositropha]|uniref:precorrin-2 dehydrogenase/sirohydrochlorin ferrochelatase family protein n=1 Tax=Natronobiforma cellulositropha TaxID=1679076 RepID=UPI0021D5B936|nr:bifunctional precorrin-2 dehydrogenase/sirohydrochlorin ferrochelatase [Natronobiforma cellulositropha]
MIPLLHDFTGETVLVFGGGPVGARKARRFAREARVIVLSPTFTDREFGGATRLRVAPGPEEVDGWVERTAPALVIAATDDEAVNDAVVAAARQRGLLYNHATRAGDHEREVDDVVVPATVRDGPVTVAVATGGTAPALSKYLREELEETLAGAGEMAAVVASVREELKIREVSPETRRTILTDLVTSPGVWTTLRTGSSNTQQVIEDVLEQTFALSSDSDTTAGESP